MGGREREGERAGEGMERERGREREGGRRGEGGREVREGERTHVVKYDTRVTVAEFSYLSTRGFHVVFGEPPGKQKKQAHLIG